MYSGLAITNTSGSILGVHQKFNKVAFRYLKHSLNDESSVFFPPLDLILHFEGKNGPDGLKIKSPGCQEPHHFYNPYDPLQTLLLDDLRKHFQALKKALVFKQEERAAFQAAWLAHVIVDGLTPAHHYPYLENIDNLKDNFKQTSKVTDKIMIKRKHLALSLSKDKSQTGLMKLVDKNWQLWGGKGMIVTHALFEFGVALIIKPLNFKKYQPSQADYRIYEQRGLIETFKDFSVRIADHEMYRNFCLWGWTPRLALQVKNLLAPLTIKLIALAWQQAICQAQALKTS